ncbi:MAG: protein kinase domain-containing protein, partial [Gemmatimonadota bacterium]
HRDIKPGNVLFESGHAVICDFGVARAILAASDGPGGTPLTGPGLAVGTPEYMSPEQAAGDPVDARSDLYSLGCVMYEMLVGYPPLTGSTPRVTLALRISETPPPLRPLRDTIPEELDRTVARCLAKLPGDRFQTSRELAAALSDVARRAEDVEEPWPRSDRREAAGGRPLEGVRARSPMSRRRWVLAAGGVVLAIALWIGLGVRGGGDPPRFDDAPATFERTSIAVLPFEDDSPGGDLGYLAAGLTRELIGQLTAVDTLDVRSYETVRRVRGEAPPDSVGRALRVGLLVDGTVDAHGDRVIVRLDLVEPRTGRNLESFRAERARVEGVILVSDIARELGEGLRRQLGVHIELQARRAQSEAWELVQRAEELRDAAEDLQRAGDAAAAAAVLLRADSLLTDAERRDSGWVEPILARGRMAAIQAGVVPPGG